VTKAAVAFSSRSHSCAPWSPRDLPLRRDSDRRSTARTRAGFDRALSVSATRIPCGSTSGSTLSPNRVSTAPTVDAVLFQSRSPTSETAGGYLEPDLRPRGHGPAAAAPSAPTGKNVRSVPGCPRRPRKRGDKCRVVLVDAALDERIPRIRRRSRGFPAPVRRCRDVVEAVDGVVHDTDFIPRIRSGDGRVFSPRSSSVQGGGQFTCLSSKDDGSGAGFASTCLPVLATRPPRQSRERCSAT
jgi:hypothetical protein